jgi:predicted glycoside hydrolase/deacetylase ChbG (UPF0249 family)
MAAADDRESAMGAISLIVRADDFGLCHAANQAVLEAFETGILTCASVVVVSPWVAEAAALVGEHPEWEIGLQFVLHCSTAGCRWGPVVGPGAVPSLVEATGTFPPNLPAAADPADFVREIIAQFQRARAWGISPAYLEFDGEAHPAADSAFKELSKRFGVPARMTAWGVRPLKLPSLAEKSGEEALRDVLTSLVPGTSLWVARPAHDSPETWGLWPDGASARARQADALALCSAALEALVRQHGIELISFRQYLEERLGTEAEE